MISASLPQQFNAEQTALNLMINEEAARPLFAQALSAKHFSDSRHRQIFQALTGLQRQGRAADLIILGEELKREKALEDAGGYEYLAEIASQDGPNASIPSRALEYVQILRQYGQRRHLYRTSEELQQQVEREDSPEEVVQTLRRLADDPDFLPWSSEESNAHQIASETLEAYEEAEKLHQSGRSYAGIDTGFGVLNNLLNGLRPAELTVLAARPSIGKTTLALQIALHAARSDDCAVGILSLEMSRPQLGARLSCFLGGTDPELQRRGSLEGEARDNYIEAVAELSRLPINIFCADRHIDQIAGRLSQPEKPDLWIIDHLHRIHGPGNSHHEKITEQVGRIKDLAVDYNVPILLLAQLNRSCEDRPDKKPQLSDLRESGSIEEHADNCLMIHRPGFYASERAKRPDDPNIASEVYLLAEKTRFGPVGEVPLRWDPNSAQFANEDHYREPSIEYDAYHTWNN